ncbi:hypothetical protein [Bradyrhizobium sp. RDI18]|uniref:hypothetical protein n=1 Tax=Bradyrhizobium sp. RDI18 TaxID=3367400 RepID=UPI003711A2D4
MNGVADNPAGNSESHLFGHCCDRPSDDGALKLDIGIPRQHVERTAFLAASRPE